MCKLERDIAILQDHEQNPWKNTILWASNLKDIGQTYFFMIKQHNKWEILESEKKGLTFTID